MRVRDYTKRAVILVSSERYRKLSSIIFIAVVALIGIISVLVSHAFTPTISIEPENGGLSSAVGSGSDSSASNGSYVKFGVGGLGGSFSPALLASTTDFTNPMRGFYHWRNSSQYFSEDSTGKLTAGGTNPSLDRFDRYYWGDIPMTTATVAGKTVHTYDFSTTVVKDLLAYTDPAKNGGITGRRFGIRMRAMSDGTDGQSHIPSFVCTNTYNNVLGGVTYKVDIPEWDQSCFQAPLDEMMSQLATALAPYHKQVNYMDIVIYGQWGEWNPNSSNFKPVDSANTVSVAASAATLDYIINEHVKYFGWSQLLLFVIAPTAEVNHAMDLPLGTSSVGTLAKPIGLRSDAYDRPCFLGGHSVFDYTYDPTNTCSKQTNTLAQSSRPASLLNRWKTAPFIGERGNTKNSSGVFDYTTQPVNELVDGYHVSSISNDYYESPKTTALDNLYKKAALGAGYRLVVSKVQMSGTLAKPVATVSWLNQGNSPPYDPWDTTVWLAAGGTTVGTATVSLPDSSLLPDATVTQAFNITTTAALKSGTTYTVMLRIADPGNYLPNLKLALSNGTSGAGYTLGSFTP